jgi:hypothetical protein
MLEKFTLIDGITVHSGFGHSSKFEFWLKGFQLMVQYTTKIQDSIKR